MPETAILNANVAWQDDIQDSIAPDYMFTNSRPTTRAVTKPAGGQPSSRETSNSGHVFQVTWLRRSWLCIQRIRQFAEQYEDGFFTIIDHDGGGRHYVGNFVDIPSHTEAGNDLYNIQGATFQEIPGVPMVEYPSDWDNDAVALQPVTDYGELRVATSGTWATQTQISADGISTTILKNSGAVAGEWATHEYRGYGFRLYLAKGPACGQVRVYLDGVDLGVVDCYSAVDEGAQIAIEQGTVPLDLHRVKVVVLGTKNAGASSPAVTWSYLVVMR